jgi:4-amino-4-deoxy-L-arabinose transferase-like glycosyltransferase
MTASDPLDDDRAWRRQLWWLLVAGTLARLAFAASTGLGVDESYAVTVARTPSWSYFDHPPLHFWLVGGWARLWALAGDATHTPPAWWLRLPFIACAAIATWAIHQIGRDAFGARAGLVGALCYTAMPVLSATSGSWVLPDGPLLAASSVAVCWFGRLLYAPAPARAAWVWAGIALGLAALAKYHAIFVALAVAVAWATGGAAVRARWRGVAGAALLSALVALPVFLWNAAHDWASFRFQGGRAAAQGLRLDALATMLGGQAAYLLPWMLVLLTGALVTAHRRRPAPAVRLLVVAAAGPIVAFTLPSLWSPGGLPHWTAPGWAMACPLAGWWMTRDRGLLRARRWLGLGLVTTAALMLVVASDVRTAWLSRRLPATVQGRTPTLELADWRPLRDSLARRGWLGPETVVAAPSWIQAGKLGIALGPRIAVTCACDDARHFRFVPTAAPTVHVARWRAGDGGVPLHLLTVPAPLAVTAVRTGPVASLAPGGQRQRGGRVADRAPTPHTVTRGASSSP